MDSLKDLLKVANPVIILMLLFLIWQVVNHLPSEIKEVRREVNQKIEEVEQKIENMEEKFE